MKNLRTLHTAVKLVHGGRWRNLRGLTPKQRRARSRMLRRFSDRHDVYSTLALLEEGGFPMLWPRNALKNGEP